MRESRRMTAVQTPIIPIVGDLVRSTPGTISLGQGVVAYGPPQEAIDALAGVTDDLKTHLYGAVEGTSALRQALAAKLRAENGIAVDDSTRVVVTAGGNMAFFNAVLAVADVGDEVSLQTPYYFTYGAGRPFSPSSIPGSAGHTISLYTFSKAYGFAGWRIGYMVIPASLEEAVRKIQDTNLICPTMIAQAAALGALKAGASYCKT